MSHTVQASIQEPPSSAQLAKQFKEDHTHLWKDIQAVISRFNLDALKSQATRTLEKICTACDLIAMGGFNTVFVLTFEDGSDIIARLNGSNANQDSYLSESTIVLRIESEAATLRFLKHNTTIPVPAVHLVVTDQNNPVGAQYMLMERLVGRLLVLENLPFEDQEKFVTKLASFQAQLLMIRFDSIGCLFDSPDGGSVVGPLGQSGSYPSVLDKDLGPFKSSRAFIQAHVDAELELLTTNVTEWERRWCNIWIPAGSFPSTYALKWYQLFSKGLRGLPIESTPESPFVLFHAEMSDGNVLVSYNDPTEITGIIDWEASRIAPLWDAHLYLNFLSIPPERETDEIARLRDIEEEIYRAAEPEVYSSPLDLGGLLRIIRFGPRNGPPSSRESMDRGFLAWYDWACRNGHSDEVRSFHELKQLIVEANIP